MAFPAKVSKEVLKACGRCCSICHRFCGKKIEIHHIIQKSDGGPDTFENAIPLCYNCHADMGKTDPHHPKGRNYTESELKYLRDLTYDLVKSGKLPQTVGSISMNDKETRCYWKRYKKLRFEVSYILDYYANIYTNIIVYTNEENVRYEKASDILRSIGVKIIAFTKEERPRETKVPSTEDLSDAGRHFIGLSNSLYYPKGGDVDLHLKFNRSREKRIREVFGI